MTQPGQRSAQRQRVLRPSPDLPGNAKREGRHVTAVPAAPAACAPGQAAVFKGRDAGRHRKLAW